LSSFDRKMLKQWADRTADCWDHHRFSRSHESMDQFHQLLQDNMTVMAILKKSLGVKIK